MLVLVVFLGPGVTDIFDSDLHGFVVRSGRPHVVESVKIVRENRVDIICFFVFFFLSF